MGVQGVGGGSLYQDMVERKVFPDGSVRKLGSPLGDLATKVFKEALDGAS